MTVCWYCSVNAWPAEIVDANDAVLEKFAAHRDDVEQAMEWGIGARVWNEENFDDKSIRYHQGGAMAYAEKGVFDPDWATREAVQAILLSYELLLKIPEDVRVPYADEDELMEYFKLHDAPPPPKGPMKPKPRG